MRLNSSRQSQAKCVIWIFRSWRKKTKIANSVDEKVVSFDSVFDETPNCVFRNLVFLAH